MLKDVAYFTEKKTVDHISLYDQIDIFPGRFQLLHRFARQDDVNPLIHRVTLDL